MSLIFVFLPVDPTVGQPCDEPELQGGIAQQAGTPENQQVDEGGEDIERETGAAAGGHTGYCSQAQQGSRPFQHNPLIHGRENRISAQDVVAPANPFAKKLFF
jgi:hypothetical protein